MAKRKSKSGNKQQFEDTSLLLESSAPQTSHGINAYVLPALLCLILAVGGSTMGWFCTQQQHNLDQLSESYTAMQTRITKLQQVMGMRDVQMDTGLEVEERILALEEAQKQAQQAAEVALATSEKLKNTDLHSALHAEMDTQLAERQQVAISVATLQAMFKNQSEEFEAVKEGVAAILSSSSALAASVAGLTGAAASTNSRVDEQVTSMEALNVQLEEQDSELNELKVSLDLHKVVLYTNSQEVVAIKEFVRAEQAMRALALEEKLSSVQKTLDEQLFTSQTLHSNIKAQLQNVHTQLVSGGQIEVKSNEEGPAAEEFIDATEVQEELEDVEEQAERQDAEEAADEEESEEHEAAGETEEEETTEDTVEGQVLEESLEEEESEDVEEEPVELESEVLEEEDEEDA
uniref:uncharacterized protein n=1 Tax=Centroberyx gerrardi TaxID=166262 RepID=UPI003AAB08A7